MMNEAEIQEGLLRFTGDLISQLTDSADGLDEELSPKQREAAIRQLVRYESSALEIATGSMPEVGLCDMAVFVGLCRGVFERYWLGVFGADNARRVLAVWRDAEDRIRAMAVKTMSDAQWVRLRQLIDDWLEQNPKSVMVEGIRFAEFSTLVGRIAAGREQETKGIFGSVRSATTSADQALLLVDRVLFLVNRMPFVLRLHARLAAYELTSDAKGQLGGVERMLARVPEARPLVHDVAELTVEARDTAHEARALLVEAKPILERLAPAGDARSAASSAERLDKALILLDRLHGLLGRVGDLLPNDPRGALATLNTVGRKVDRFARRGVLYLVALGAAWSVLMWGGYVAARRLAR